MINLICGTGKDVDVKKNHLGPGKKNPRTCRGYADTMYQEDDQ